MGNLNCVQYKLKTSGILHKGVRLPDSGAETSVMEVERSGQQSSHHVLNSHSSNTAGIGRRRLGKGQPFPNRWTRISLRTWRDFTSMFQNLLLPYGRGAQLASLSGLDGSNTLRVDKTLISRGLNHV